MTHGPRYGSRFFNIFTEFIPRNDNYVKLVDYTVSLFIYLLKFCYNVHDYLPKYLMKHFRSPTPLRIRSTPS